VSEGYYEGFYEGTCRANGIDIHYWRTGEGKPPVVLLHGLTDNGACWFPLARALREEYDVILPDARGHGRSSAPERGYEFETQAEDAAQFLKALGLERPVLGGHSLGGIVALLAAQRGGVELSGLILEDPVFLPPVDRLERRSSDWPQRHAQVLETPLEELEADGRRRMPHWSDEVIKLWAASKHETKMQVFQVMDAAPPDFRAAAAAVKVPVLLVTGEKERGAIVSQEVAAELRALNPLWEVEHVSGAGHCIRYDKPDAFERAVRQFLRRVLG